MTFYNVSEHFGSHLYFTLPSTVIRKRFKHLVPNPTSIKTIIAISVPKSSVVLCLVIVKVNVFSTIFAVVETHAVTLSEIHYKNKWTQSETSFINV